MTFMSTLEVGIINVALPTMAKELSVSTEDISWVVTVFLIVVTSTILILGKLGDITGKTGILLSGVAVFTVGSFLCGISNTFYFLLVARIIQAIGASGAMATNQGIIAQTFPINERGKALGISGSFVALGSLVGPPLGGLMLSFMSWNYLFFINVPIGIFVFIMGTKIIPADNVNNEIKQNDRITSEAHSVPDESSDGVLENGLDKVNVSRHADGPGGSSGTGKRPVLQFEILKNKLFTLSIFCALISFIALSCSTIIQPFYLQNVMKLSPAATGMIMMVNPLVLLFVAPSSGHLSDKIGSELLTFVGLAITSTGLLLMSTLTERSSLAALLIYLAVMSLGSGMFQSPNTSMIMSSVTRDKLGMAGSINAFMRNMGMVLGTALATTLLYDLMSLKLGYKVTNFIDGQESVFIFGMRYVYITAAAICGAGVVLTALRLISRRKSKGC